MNVGDLKSYFSAPQQQASPPVKENDSKLKAMVAGVFQGRELEQSTIERFYQAMAVSLNELSQDASIPEVELIRKMQSIADSVLGIEEKR